MNKYTASRTDPVTTLVATASVVAATMRDALRWFESTAGLSGEPAMLYKAENNVLMASDAPQAAFSFVIDPAVAALGANIYPEAMSVYAGTDVIFTAVAPVGHSFVRYEDALGNVLATTPIATINIPESMVITAVYT